MRRLMKAFICALKSFKITVNQTENPGKCSLSVFSCKY